MHQYQRILSGVRPTGSFHLGNYLGAVRQWVEMSRNTETTLFCIVDQHALTTADDACNLAKNCRAIAAAYIACGIDPLKNSIFIQSHVPAHTELAWYLSCVSPLGWLNRMTQFKDKAGKNKETANLGLYAYPVLMAADILLYKASHVPVGEDQKQHVELARDLAQAFNNFVNQPYFSLPEPVICAETARIMSLRDGTKKMSKSDISDYSRIHLLDNADAIALKIRKAKTDSEPIPDNIEALENRPEAKNLLSIYATLTNSSLLPTLQQFEGSTFSTFKQSLIDVLIEKIIPIGNTMRKLIDDTKYLDQILKNGADSANAIADASIKDIRKLLGMTP